MCPQRNNWTTLPNPTMASLTMLISLTPVLPEYENLHPGLFQDFVQKFSSSNFSSIKMKAFFGHTEILSSRFYDIWLFFVTQKNWIGQDKFVKTY